MMIHLDVHPHHGLVAAARSSENANWVVVTDGPVRMFPSITFHFDSADEAREFAAAINAIRIKRQQVDEEAAPC